MAEVIRDGYYVKQTFGFRDIGGEHQKDRYVDVQIAGAWLESILWRSEGWEVWTSPKIRDRISIDVASNDRLRQKREDDREKALAAERENADKMSATRDREEKKQELLAQVKVLNTKIKALE
jgi:outer membrane murein-binding lipoprotein Lpp